MSDLAPHGVQRNVDCLAHLVDDHVDDLTLLDWKSSVPADQTIWSMTSCSYLPTAWAIPYLLRHPQQRMVVIGRPSATKPDIWEVDEEELDQLEVQFIERLQRQNQLSPVQWENP